MHLDQDVVRSGDGFVDVDDPDVRGTGGLEDLDGAHGAIMSSVEPGAPRTRPILMRRALLVLPVLAVVLTACGTTSTSSEPACCAPPGPATVSGSSSRGGPAGARPQHWSGTISITGHRHATAHTDGQGHFDVTLSPGRYRITGTSPSFDSGRGTCTAQGTVRVRPHRITFVRVVCPLR